MKSFRQMKKWTLMSVLLCGISLAAYAIAPQVKILWSAVSDVTSTTAHLDIEARGVEKLTIEVWRSDVRVSLTEWDTNSTSPDDEIVGYFDISNLFPNTEYRVVIIAEGFADPTGQTTPNEDTKELNFTTTSQPES